MEIVSWTPGDNGREVGSVKPEHAYFVEGTDGVNGYAAAPAMTAPPAPVAAPAPAPPAPAAASAPAPAAAAPAASGMSFEDFLKSQGQGK